MSNSILSIIGTRPQLVKFSAIQTAFRKRNINHEYIDTGQHYDPELSTNFAKELEITQPKINLQVGSASPNQQLANMIVALDSALSAQSPSMIIVYGDTNSTLAATLVAVKKNIPVLHVEAGLRSNNNKMQEEINRKAVDHLSSVLFPPTITACSNLKNEGLQSKSHMFGVVMLDLVKNLVKTKKIFNLGGVYQNSIVCTLHRAENTNSPSRIKFIFGELGKLNQEILLFAHPRLQKTLKEFSITTPANLQLHKPINHTALLQIVLNSFAIVTDSGGLQKESFFLGKRCVTFREESEWPETLTGNMNSLINVGQSLKEVLAKEIQFTSTPYFGNGNAAEKIVEFILNYSME